MHLVFSDKWVYDIKVGFWNRGAGLSQAGYKGEIYLVNESVYEPAGAGLYRFDPATGRLEKQIHLERALRVLFPEQPSSSSR